MAPHTTKLSRKKEAGAANRTGIEKHDPYHQDKWICTSEITAGELITGF